MSKSDFEKFMEEKTNVRYEGGEEAGCSFLMLIFLIVIVLFFFFLLY